MATGISLANKSQLLFGFAVVVILGVALSVPWFWSRSLVLDSQQELMRAHAETWLASQMEGGEFQQTGDQPQNLGDNVLSEFNPTDESGVRIGLVWVDRLADEPQAGEEFAADAVAYLARRENTNGWMWTERLERGHLYHYALALYKGDIEALRSGELPDYTTDETRGELRAIVVVDHVSQLAAGKLLVTRVYIVAAWLFASLVAILVFYFILTKLIFSPVRRLRETVERVEAGDTQTRAMIKTGDEFEQLSDAFNNMLARMEDSQQRLRRMNETLDLRLSELAESNLALYESNKLKGEFLASVSHELKTPLNSILGFSDLLYELAQADPQADPKRARYLSNIRSSASSLLEMISDLLEMAKIEAGRVELTIETTSIPTLLDGLVALMAPQAQQREVRIETRVAQNLPDVETDAGKLQQILYNFVSNAIKFSPRGGVVMIAAERLTRQGRATAVRIGVADQGPGIPPDMQETIFEKFRQVDASHTREHKGVGLGLAICRELADMLHVSLSVVSEPGEGASFWVEVPIEHRPPQPRPLMAASMSESDANTS